MNDIVLSLNNGLLKLTFYGTEGFGTASLPLPAEIAADTTIVDIPKFCENITNVLPQVMPANVRGSALTVLLEPKEVILEFVTIPKNGADLKEQVLSIISGKLEKGTILEDLYYSYQKIAPFVYQFVAVKKEVLENYLEVATTLNLSLKAVVPWVLLLPKLVNDNKPSIFVFKNDDNSQTVALSELNGIYFASIYEKEQTQEELAQLVQTLSGYRRVVPINKVYTVNCDSFTLDPNYKVLPLDILGGDLTDVSDYENHLLFSNVAANQPGLLDTQLNFLNLLPLPVKEKSKNALVPVGASVAALLILGLVGYFGIYKGGFIFSPVAEAPSEVLSEVVETTESTDSVVVSAELKKEDLVIRVENGSGVTGAAGKFRDFLQELGYTVLSIGDADESDRQTTLLKFKSGKKDYKNLLVTDTQDDYNLVIEEDLEEHLDYDVLIIVGLE
jgi:hypothetical protein